MLANLRNNLLFYRQQGNVLQTKSMHDVITVATYVHSFVSIVFKPGWFLEITFIHKCMRAFVCVCVYAPEAINT